MRQQDWRLLVMSIPGQQGSERVRIWRALKSLGAAVLRDGVYLIPGSTDSRSALERQRDAVRRIGGRAYVFHRPECEPDDKGLFVSLFDRSEDYAALIEQISSLRALFPELPEAEARRREIDAIGKVDFFPSEAGEAATAAMAALDEAANAQYSPDEPESKTGRLPWLDKSNFRGRLWATRKEIWVDRIASAWLIRRFIDAQAEFIWLEKPSDCPEVAVGFDFNGAEFSHVGDRVTYPVLLHCFSLESDSALERIGTLVNFLDVGGIPVADASGFATVLAGARQRYQSDDGLLAQASCLPDFLCQAYANAA